MAKDTGAASAAPVHLSHSVAHASDTETRGQRVMCCDWRDDSLSAEPVAEVDVIFDGGVIRIDVRPLGSEALVDVIVHTSNARRTA